MSSVKPPITSVSAPVASEYDPVGPWYIVTTNSVEGSRIKCNGCGFVMYHEGIGIVTTDNVKSIQDYQHRLYICTGCGNPKFQRHKTDAPKDLQPID